jgi:hypothetical protein
VCALSADDLVCDACRDEMKELAGQGCGAAGGAYTLVQSCRRLGISTRDYLIDVLGKVEGGWPLRRIGALVPTRWAEDRGLWTPQGIRPLTSESNCPVEHTYSAPARG